MKRILLPILATLFMSAAFCQKKTLDPISLLYVLTPTAKYKKDILPQFEVSLKLNNKKYNLHQVVTTNSKAGDIIPDTVFNRKNKRNEYMLKTWFAGGGKNFKAYIAGSKAAGIASIMVYVQSVEEQVADSKWRLIKAIKL